MHEIAVNLGFFVLGAGVGLGFANRIYVAKSKLYMNEITIALDSIGIKRSEFLPVSSDVRDHEQRLRQIEKKLSLPRQP